MSKRRLSPAARRALRRVRRSEGGRAPQISVKLWNVCAVTHSTNAGAGGARVWAWVAHTSLSKLPQTDYWRSGIDCWAGTRSEAIRLAGAPRTRWIFKTQGAEEVWSFDAPFLAAPAK